MPVGHGRQIFDVVFKYSPFVQSGNWVVVITSVFVDVGISIEKSCVV